MARPQYSVAFDPSQGPPEPTAEVAALVSASPRVRIHALVHDGRRYWLKRACNRHSIVGRAVHRMIHRLPVRGAAWIPLPEDPSESLRREGRRLAHLRDAGFSVPAALAAGDDWLLLEDAGTPVREILATASSGDAQDLVAAVFDDLVSLHRAGYWHGGAQVKNTLVAADGRRSLIDFEDPFPASVDLRTLQARDLFLLTASVVDRVAASVLGRMLVAYSARCGDEVAAEAAWTTEGLLGRAVAWIPGGDARRARLAARLLADVT